MWKQMCITHHLYLFIYKYIIKILLQLEVTYLMQGETLLSEIICKKLSNYISGIYISTLKQKITRQCTRFIFVLKEGTCDFT